MDTECSDAESSSSHGVSWSNLTTPCCVQGSRQRHYSRSHDLQNENVLLLVIFQTYGVSSRHDGHSYVCSMGLWFLLRTVCCNCCKRSDTQHSLLCSLCSVSVTLRPFSWLRFIDDIDMKWLHGRDNLDTFLQEANSFHSTIQFTAEVSNDKHVFLDTQSRLDEDRISTDLYTKPTDTHQYLLPTSCHPKHCCKNIPYSLALRLRRICSDSNTFELRAKELTNQLHRRGYLKQDIASAIDKARQRSRDALLSYRPKSAEVGTILPFVLTYHPDLPKVRDIVDKNWSIIESSDELKDIYQSKPVMAFRRPKSLRDFLVRARLKPNSDDDNQTGECRPCGRKRCQCCKMITTAGTVKSSSGATVRLRQNTDCTTENVVYLISCSSCNKQYVGETKGPLNKRMNGHRDDWRHRRFERSPTAEHFHSADHDFLSNASVCCLEHNKEWSDSTRKLRESYWIRRLNTLCPFGINKGD